MEERLSREKKGYTGKEAGRGRGIRRGRRDGTEEAEGGTQEKQEASGRGH